MKRKALSLILVCVTLLAASGAANFAGSAYAGIPDSITNGTSPVRSLFAACVSPLNTLETIVNGENPVAARFASPQKAPEGENAADAVLLPGTFRGVTEINPGRTMGPLNGIVRESVFSIDTFREHDPPGGGGFVLLFLLMFLATLYVRNLPGDAFARLLSIRPDLRMQIGFFYWGLHV